MTTQALVVANDPVFAEWLGRAAGEVLEIIPLPVTADIETVLAQVQSQMDTGLVFCEFTGEAASGRAALVERLVERTGVPVVGLAAEEQPDWILAAMRAGARDFLVLGRDDATVLAQVRRLLRRGDTGGRRESEGPRGEGKVFAVLGGQPHTGIAFLAEHLALALLDTVPPGQRVLVADLSTPAGGASIFLNVSQAYSVLDAVRDSGRCDETLVESAFTRHGSGLYVLSLPEDLLGTPAVPPDDLMRLLRVLRGLFRYVVVALDGHLTMDVVGATVARADRTLLLSDQSIIRSRHTKYMLRALRELDCPLDRTGLVVDEYRRRLGLEPRNLAELFELPLLGALSTEGYNRMVSMNSGEPLFTLARKDPYVEGVRQLASTLARGETLSVGRPRGLLDRWLG